MRTRADHRRHIMGQFQCWFYDEVSTLFGLYKNRIFLFFRPPRTTLLRGAQVDLPMGRDSVF